MMRSIFISLIAIAAAVSAPAAGVRWEPPGGTLGVGQTTQIELVFEDCEPTEEVRIPTIPDASIGRPSQSSQTSIVNFKMSRRTSLSYPVLPIRRGTLTIPAFEVETDQGKKTVKAVSYAVGDATVGHSDISIDAIAGSQLTTDTKSVWEGEVFSLKYSLLIVRRFNPTSVGVFEWEAPPGLVTESWDKPQSITAVVDGEPRVGFAHQTRAYARTGVLLSSRMPASRTIPAARQLINLETGLRAFGLFTRPTVEQYLIVSSQPSLVVRPLPLPAPANFQKAVGEFNLESTVVPQAAAVGEPVTWTLKLEGTGNWPEGLTLPSREVSRDFQVIRPQVNRTTKDGSLFDGSISEDVVLVPTKPGTYTLGPVNYSYFNPKDGRYQTLTTRAVTVIVRPAITPGSSTGGNGVFSFVPEDPVQKTPAPGAPGRLPLDPLIGTATAMPPSQGIPFGWILAPVIPLMLAWFGFALRRARTTDSLRAQREALAQMPGVLASVKRAGTPAATASALRDWQNTAVGVFGLHRAAPSTAEFASACFRFLTPQAAEDWKFLWSDAEAAIYGKSSAIPADWTLRASAAARVLRLPPFRPERAFSLTNLWPAAALALIAVFPPDMSATDAQAAYRAGDFSTAERTWRAEAMASPLDWKARNNLGLALAQQDRWSEAAGQWAAAFAQNPAEPAVQFQFALGVSRAEFTSPQLSNFAENRGATWLARIASPAQWQSLLGLASFLAAAAGVLYLWDRYEGRRRWRILTASALLAAGVATAATATGALRAWGPLADPDIALVWTPTELRSVPTEADEQQTQPLGAGTLARIDHQFLGWVRLAFPDGQTGWVRREVVVPFYR